MKPDAADAFRPRRQPSGRSPLRHDDRDPAEPAAANGSFERGTVARYARGTEIIAQGDADSRIGLIVSGLVKVSMTSGNGDSYIVQILHEGQLVGDPWLGQSAFSWGAATHAGICWLTPDSVLRSGGSDNTQLLGLSDTLAGQLREAQFSALSLRGRNALQRIAYWILAQICCEPGPAEDKHIQILLTRRDLASLLDMTVETLSRVMHQLDEHGAIALLTPDTLRVRDLARLFDEAKLSSDSGEGERVDDGWRWGSRFTHAGPKAA